jgi:hypothetical protein
MHLQERTMFYLVKVTVTDGVASETPLTDSGTFETGSDASRAAKAVGLTLGCKVQPRRIAQAADWRPKAAEDLEKLSAHYKLPPAWDLVPIPDHFARRENIGSALISYFASPEQGVINRRTSQAAGRYLAQFYPDLQQEELKRYLAMVDPSGQLMFATTPEDATTVYDSGPDSCMLGDKGRYLPGGTDALDTDDFNDDADDVRDQSDHVCRIYGTGDLALAYLQDGSGRITARSVCWPEKKLHGRVYGDIARLNQKLKDEGFTKVETFPGGARVEPLEAMVDGERRFALPYFDNVAGITMLDDGTFVTGESGKNPDVVIEGGRDEGYQGRLKRWCGYGQCYAPLATMKQVEGGPHLWISDYAARNGHAWTCAATGRLFHRSIPGVRMWNDEQWCRDAFDKDGANCPFTSKNYPKSAMKPASDGTLVFMGAVKDYERLLDARKAASATPRKAGKATNANQETIHAAA